MESLCRQSAVFHPLESWRLLAEAEMWNHKAQQEAAGDGEFAAVPPVPARAAMFADKAKSVQAKSVQA